ncbi:MAG: DUF4276 family protein [Bacteroidota bacterium]
MSKRKKKKVLIIEGSASTATGDLKNGFSALLRNVIDQDMPKIFMGNGKFQAIKRFKKHKKADFCFLLIDLDKDEEFKEEELKNLKLDQYKDWVFFMVQEVEAWFISQPEVLDHYYQTPISSKLPKKRTQQIKKPSDILKSITKKTKKGTYNKKEHAIALLKILDAQQLRTDFEEFDRLIEKILNPTDK